MSPVNSRTHKMSKPSWTICGRSGLAPVRLVERRGLFSSLRPALKTRYAPIIASTAMCYTGIVSPAAVQKFGDAYGRNPVGTGPFKFKEWQAKNFISIVRNDGYWGEKAYLDEVVFKVIPEGGARMMGLKAGDLDMVVQPVPSELPGFRKDPKFTLAETIGGRIIYVGFNMGLAPTNHPKVRQALSMAVNVPAIVEAWYCGEEAGTAIAEVLFGDYNPAGRLPMTVYRSLSQLPPLSNYELTGVNLGRTYMYFTGTPQGHQGAPAKGQAPHVPRMRNSPILGRVATIPEGGSNRPAAPSHPRGGAVAAMFHDSLTRIARTRPSA